MIIDNMRLIDFYATWCEPCKWSEPVIEEVIKRLEGRVTLQKVDIDQEPELTARYGIRSVPTFILTDGESELWRMNGFDTPSRMTEQILSSIETRP